MTAHFAKLGTGDIVEEVQGISNDIAVTEQAGLDFINQLYNTRDVWIQTSPNGSFRKNFAGTGYTYDRTRDAFIPPQPYPSWTLVEATCQWTAPVTYPDDGKRYEWNEATTSWKEIP